MWSLELMNYLKQIKITNKNSPKDRSCERNEHCFLNNPVTIFFLFYIVYIISANRSVIFKSQHVQCTLVMQKEGIFVHTVWVQCMYDVHGEIYWLNHYKFSSNLRERKLLLFSSEPSRPTWSLNPHTRTYGPWNNPQFFPT